MPKQVAEAEFEAIVNALSGLAGGGSVSRIREALGETMPRRTLQRRLAVLVAQGRLVREGRGQGTLYRLPAAQSARPAQAAESQERRRLQVSSRFNIHDGSRIIHLGLEGQAPDFVLPATSLFCKPRNSKRTPEHSPIA